MSKKLMLLAAAALSALAFAALPATASAGQFPIHCEVASGAQCTSTISGGTVELSTTGTEAKVHCTSVTGNASQTNHTSTGTALLTFHGCSENVFGTSCTSAGQSSGTIQTNSLTSHTIYIEKTGTPGVLLTGVNVTFTCFGGFVKKTVHGNVIGHFENPNCGVTQASHSISFQQNSAGHQKYNQITTEGPIYDLVSNGDDGSAFVTSAQVGTGTLTHATKTALTC